MAAPDPTPSRWCSRPWQWALTALLVAVVPCLLAWPRGTVRVAGAAVGVTAVVVGLRMLAAERHAAGECPGRNPETGGPAADSEFPGPFQVWPLARILRDVAVGSGDWTWCEEWADLDQRHAATGYLTTLEQQIRENGITMPVLIGNDGRLWDGHHRLRIAVRLGIGYVPVEIVAPAPEVVSGSELTADEARDAVAFVEEMCDMADREDVALTTARVREWLRGPKPGQRVSFPPATPGDPDA